MNFEMSKAMEEVVLEVLEDTTSTVYEYEVMLVNPDTGFELEMQHITAYSITQDFANTYTDSAHMGTDVDVIHYKDILLNLQGLTCTITLFPFDTIYRVRLDEEPLIFEYLAYMTNQADADMVTNASKFNDLETGERLTIEQQELRIPITMNLITSDAYKLRHTKINSKFNGTNMEDTIHWLGNRMKCEKVKVIPPDNKETYDNLVIPPMKDMSSIFTYLQDRNGVYSKGVGAYYTDKTLWVYPQHCTKDETAPDKTVINVYNVPTGNYPGLESYHRLKDEMLDIVSISDVEIDTPATVATENRGNVHMYTHADGLRDKFVTIGGDGKVMRNEGDITAIERANKTPDMQKDIQNIEYKGEQANIYKSTELMANEEMVKVKASWRRATPNIIKPGINTIYHFDNTNGVYQIAPGRILGAAFAGGIRGDGTSKGWLDFTCTLDMTVQVSEATSPAPTTSVE